MMKPIDTVGFGASTGTSWSSTPVAVEGTSQVMPGLMQVGLV